VKERGGQGKREREVRREGKEGEGKGFAGPMLNCFLYAPAPYGNTV